MRNNKSIYPIITLILIVIIFIYGIRQYNDRQTVLEDFQIDTAEMVAYDEVGSENNPKVEYRYKGDDAFYEKRVSSPVRFPKCAFNLYACKDKRFRIIYSTKDPSKSLINLKIEIQNIENPKFPDDLDDFR